MKILGFYVFFCSTKKLLLLIAIVVLLLLGCIMIKVHTNHITHMNCFSYFNAVSNTAWNVSRYRVFTGPYFPEFGLNTERYRESLRIQPECGKIWTRKNSVFVHFSRSASYFISFFRLCSIHQLQSQFLNQSFPT